MPKLYHQIIVSKIVELRHVTVGNLMNKVGKVQCHLR
jgi:hypothetical protein